MEPKLESKKRKQQPPSNPFVGVFSRSKAQIYVHQNRSGRARSDTVPKQRHHINLIPPTPSRKRRAIGDPEAVDPQIASRTPVKDLRARRVFSPGASIEDNCSPDGGNGNPKSKTDLVIDCSPMNSEVGKGETEVKLVIDLSAVGRDLVEGKDSEVESPNLSPSKGEAKVGNVNQKNDSPMAEDGQMKASVSIAPKLDETLNGNVQSKKVVSSCTRERVFKSPGSFSYRRMLPFLKDISADDSGVANTEKPGLGHSCDDQSLHKTQPKAADGGMSNGVDEMGEGDVQTTPPDRDIFFKPEIKDNKRNGNGIGVQTEDHVSKTPLKGIMKRNDRFTPEGYYRPASLKTEYTPQSKMVLNPCSRIKKLKTVTSFSYRRLLPYLMENRNQASDISTDTSRCAQPLKADDASENKIPGPALGSRFENISNGTSKTDFSPELKPATSKLTSENGLLTCELTLASDENTESLALSNSPKECTSTVKQCTLNEPKKAESVLKDTSSNLEASSPDVPFCDTDCEASNGFDKLKPTTTSAKDCKLLDGEPSKDVNTIEAVNLGVETTHFDNSGSEMSQVEAVIEKLCRSLEPEPKLKPTTTSVKDCTSLDGELLKDVNTIEAVNLGVETSLFDNSGSEMSQVEDVILKFCRSLEPEPYGSSPRSEQSSLTMTVDMPADTEIVLKESPSKSSHDVCLVSQEGNSPKDAKSSEIVSCSEDSSQLQDLIPSGNVVDGLAKGIIRRNPRGCRGLCNCLSCASFRLHADKAFEFSRNQLLDAEEVAVELMNEMSHLRDMLEKCTSVENGQASLCASQVKDACLKASQAEEMAKHRLSEMNSDLTFHCRTMQLQRPKVRFANRVQETIIPKIAEKAEVEEGRKSS